MKRTILAVLLVLLWTVAGATAADLKVGDKAPDFNLPDSKGAMFDLNAPALKGKVVSIFYVDYANKDLNNHVEDTLRNDTGLDREKGYKGMGVVNMKASMIPNFILSSGIKSKQEKNPQAIILMDKEYTLLNLWGLMNKASNLVVLDKDRICRYIYKGKLPPAEVAKLLQVIKEYQSK
jgi:predicted transcriptional regulator